MLRTPSLSSGLEKSGAWWTVKFIHTPFKSARNRKFWIISACWLDNLFANLKWAYRRRWYWGNLNIYLKQFRSTSKTRHLKKRSRDNIVLPCYFSDEIWRWRRLGWTWDCSSWQRCRQNETLWLKCFSQFLERDTWFLKENPSSNWTAIFSSESTLHSVRRYVLSSSNAGFPRSEIFSV